MARLQCAVVIIQMLKLLIPGTQYGIINLFSPGRHSDQPHRSPDCYDIRSLWCESLETDRFVIINIIIIYLFINYLKNI